MLYACPKYRSLRIRHLQFKDGLLRVDNADDQALVERNQFYGAHIVPVPEPEKEKSHGKIKATKVPTPPEDEITS